MKLSHRAYPYPVVGNADDVLDAAFQAPIEVHRDGINYYISVKVQCSSGTINRLVARGDVVHVLHVECGNTLYRAAIDFADKHADIMIAGENLNATVEVNVFARAKRDIKKYRVENAHPDYGDMTFSINAGDIVAIAEGHTFDADITFDTLRSVSSIMQIRERRGTADGPMEVDLSGEKISITLCKQDFENYKFILCHKALAPSLSSTLVMPALIEALQAIRHDESDVEHTRWCRCLKRRIDHLGLSLEHDPLGLAQNLLELPIRRAFASARQYLEAAE